MTDFSSSTGIETPSRWRCPHCNYSVTPNEIFSERKHFDAHALECVRCLYRTETKATWAEAKAAYQSSDVAQGAGNSGDVTLTESQAYHLFLVADTAARVERGTNEMINHLRELLLPTYRAWHDANPGKVHPALSIPSTLYCTPGGPAFCNSPANTMGRCSACPVSSTQSGGAAK